MMLRLTFILSILLIWQNVRAQNVNDNCENATDITSQIFNFSGFPELCNSVIGTVHDSYGLVPDIVDHSTVDMSIYSSQECIGYQPETTNEYPDIWYKSTGQGGNPIIQNVYFWGGDTIQIAVYYGQCGALFQSQCFTLTFADSAYWQGVWLEYFPHHIDDDMYIQIKTPSHYNDYIGMCFSVGYFSTIYYNFGYDRPAGTNGINHVNPFTHHLPIGISPNPANNWIDIQTDDPIIAYSVTDLLGKVRLTGNGNSNRTLANLSDLPFGTYVVTVRTEAGMGIRKFIKL
jgi:hypothetical protein